MQGRPVKKRVNGFGADITTLTRIRTALKLDARLDPNKVAKAIAHLDNLVDSLVGLTYDIESRAHAKKSA